MSILRDLMDELWPEDCYMSNLNIGTFIFLFFIQLLTFIYLRISIYILSKMF